MIKPSKDSRMYRGTLTWPARRHGIACIWMGVGSSHPMSSIPCLNHELTPRGRVMSSNVPTGGGIESPVTLMRICRRKRASCSLFESVDFFPEGWFVLRKSGSSLSSIADCFPLGGDFGVCVGVWVEGVHTALPVGSMRVDVSHSWSVVHQLDALVVLSL
jgi:hypothetical protein